MGKFINRAEEPKEENKVVYSGYQENKYDSYLDRNNIFIKILLFLVFGACIVGVGYYIFLFLSE